jgi:multicomponent K+:H+ antiporter subunit A
VPVLYRLNGAQAYENCLAALWQAAAWLLRWTGTRRLQLQLLVLMAAMVAVPLLVVDPLPAMPPLRITDLDPLFALLWLIGAACALGAAWQAKYHRLVALLLAGGVGVVTSLTFLWMSAPDLALTQLMVETVTTVLILLGLRWLPPRLPPAGLAQRLPLMSWIRRGRDGTVAVAGGLGLAAATYALLSTEAPATISDFYMEHALPDGGGANVVNVLLVDFRGFDTMGEITVLSIVALTVYALLRRFRPAPESVAIPVQQANDVDPAATQTPLQQATTGYLMVPGVYMRFLLPFMCIIAVYFFMRGHNLPGGGFVAGLIFATAVIVQYMIGGTDWIETHLRLRPHRWIALGLITACTTGLGAWLFGYPFLTSHTAHVNLPLLGEIHVPSAFVFDLGVFLAVVGTTMLILVALAHQSLRSHRAAASAVRVLPPAKEIA